MSIPKGFAPLPEQERIARTLLDIAAAVALAASQEDAADAIARRGLRADAVTVDAAARALYALATEQAAALMAKDRA